MYRFTYSEHEGHAFFFLQKNHTILSEHDFLPQNLELSQLEDNILNIFKYHPGAYYVNNGIIKTIILSEKTHDFPYKSFDLTIDEYNRLVEVLEQLHKKNDCPSPNDLDFHFFQMNCKIWILYVLQKAGLDDIKSSLKNFIISIPHLTKLDRVSKDSLHYLDREHYILNSECYKSLDQLNKELQENKNNNSEEIASVKKLRRRLKILHYTDGTCVYQLNRKLNQFNSKFNKNIPQFEYNSSARDNKHLTFCPDVITERKKIDFNKERLISKTALLIGYIEAFHNSFSKSNFTIELAILDNLFNYIQTQENLDRSVQKLKEIESGNIIFSNIDIKNMNPSVDTIDMLLSSLNKKFAEIEREIESILNDNYADQVTTLLNDSTIDEEVKNKLKKHLDLKAHMSSLRTDLKTNYKLNLECNSLKKLLERQIHYYKESSQSFSEESSSEESFSKLLDLFVNNTFKKIEEETKKMKQSKSHSWKTVNLALYCLDMIKEIFHELKSSVSLFFSNSRRNKKNDMQSSLCQFEQFKRFSYCPSKNN